MRETIKNKDIVIIPDVHGRPFWREAVKGREHQRIVFLGDYLDPYGGEGISRDSAYREFLDIIDFKKAHMDNVTLLLGNHDMGYLDGIICEDRKDRAREKEIRDLILRNIDLFDMVHVEEVAGAQMLFSHAGVRTTWIRANMGIIGEAMKDPCVLNGMLHDAASRDLLYETLANVAYIRGGMHDAGSVVWCDVREFAEADDFLPGYIQVFGHTLHDGGPYMVQGKDGAGFCMDCRRAFLIDEEGRLNYC